jgi:MFS superfamily sulfate permease-like transporter
MDMNVVIGISVGASVACLCLMCIVGKRQAEARREEEARQFRAAASPVEAEVLVYST